MVILSRNEHLMDAKEFAVRNALIATLISVFMAQPVFAAKYLCAFESYGQLGHTQRNQDAVVASYLGEKFFADTEKRLIQRGWAAGWATPDGIAEITTAPEFTAYIWTKTATDKQGRIVKSRMSYRIYQDGNTVAHLSSITGNYGTLQATGTCRQL